MRGDQRPHRCEAAAPEPRVTQRAGGLAVEEGGSKWRLLGKSLPCREPLDSFIKDETDSTLPVLRGPRSRLIASGAPGLARSSPQTVCLEEPPPESQLDLGSESQTPAGTRQPGT